MKVSYTNSNDMILLTLGLEIEREDMIALTQAPRAVLLWLVLSCLLLTALAQRLQRDNC